MRCSVATCWISRGYAWAMNLVAYDEIQATKHAEFKQQKWWSYNGNIVGVYSDTLLVGGLEHEFYFPYIGNNHPNWLSYFSEGLKPPTRLLEIAQADSGGFNQRLYGDSLFFFCRTPTSLEWWELQGDSSPIFFSSDCWIVILFIYQYKLFHLDVW